MCSFSAGLSKPVSISLPFRSRARFLPAPPINTSRSVQYAHPISYPVWAWFFLLIIAFRYLPNSIVTRPVEAVWIPLVQKPFLALPRWMRLTMGWLSLLAIVFGSAFGFKLQGVMQSR